MKYFLLLCMSLNLTSGYSQKTPQTTAPTMPVDPETKLITYSSVVEVPGVAPAELYKRCEAWMMAYYKNPTEVIRERDTASYKIVAKPRFRIANETLEGNAKTDAGLVQYTLTVAAREGRFKYTISEINWKQASYFPIERWVEQKDRYKQNNYYLYQTDSVMERGVIPALEKAMKTAPVKSNKDNW